MPTSQERIPTVVIGGGQAGLSVGYHLRRLAVPFVILDAQERVGGAWRGRWDSLRLFTPARFDGLDGKPFPAPSHAFPTKDEMADYLEAYSDEFHLPVRSGQRVKSLTKRDSVFIVETDDVRFEAQSVVVAMSSWQVPRIPGFAKELRPDIVQIHAADYRNLSQLQEGPVLVVGAGNSGSEIAIDVVGSHETVVAGPDTGHVPFRVEGRVGRLLVPVVRFVFHRVLTKSNPIARRRMPKMIASGEPLVRTKPRDLMEAGIERAPRVVGAEDGLPVLEDGRVIHAANVIWCTGFEPGFTWIDLPVFEDGRVKHDRGVADVFGLYFVGLKGLFSVSSAQVNGVGRDAERVAKLIAATMSPAPAPAGARR
ncbi:MAG TPA: NAD(P)-binding domain-containing protein [Acidimicrobiia bacterium]|nr:NAD(P)-binding domain-containing protein [Acidimicrobiia bacterium]